MDARGLITAIRAAGVSVELNSDKIRYGADQEPGEDTLGLILELSRRKLEALPILAEEVKARPGVTVDDVLRVFPGARVIGRSDLNE